MADRYAFDINRPHPNPDIEGVRQYLLSQGTTNGDHLLLLSALQDIATYGLDEVVASMADRAALHARIDELASQIQALQASVAALQTPTDPL